MHVKEARVLHHGGIENVHGFPSIQRTGAQNRTVWVALKQKAAAIVGPQSSDGIEDSGGWV